MSPATTETRALKPRFAMARVVMPSTGGFSSTVARRFGKCAQKEQA